MFIENNEELEEVINVQKVGNKNLLVESFRSNFRILRNVMKLVVPTFVFYVIMYFADAWTYLNELPKPLMFSFFMHLYISFYKSDKKMKNIFYFATFFFDFLLFHYKHVIFGNLLDKYSEDMIFVLGIFHVFKDTFLNILMCNKKKLADFFHLNSLYIMKALNVFLVFNFHKILDEYKNLGIVVKIIIVPILQFLFRIFFANFITKQVSSKMKDYNYDQKTYSVICRETEMILLWPMKYLMFIEENNRIFFYLIISNSILTIVSKFGWYIWNSAGPYILPIFFQANDFHVNMKRIDSILQREMGDKILQLTLPLVLITVGIQNYMQWEKILFVIIFEELSCVFFVYFAFKKGYNTNYSKLFPTIGSSLRIFSIIFMSIVLMLYYNS